MAKATSKKSRLQHQILPFTHESLLAFAQQIRSDTKLLRPRDFIYLQSFIWVIGSDEYPD